MSRSQVGKHYTSVVGQGSNFWLWSNRDGFDLTHPPSPDSPRVYPRIKIDTINSPITIAPEKTAFVIIDMANFFLSEAMGRKRGEGHDAEDVLLRTGLPAAREAGIQVVWMNWGISKEGLRTLPPTLWRNFGWVISEKGSHELQDDLAEASGSHEAKTLQRKEYKDGDGIGSPFGSVKLENGTTVDAGRMLMKDQWNTDLHYPLEAAYQESLKTRLPDVIFSKERVSGFWDPTGECESYLRERGITTLLFGGVDVDQCVLASIIDANAKGFDTVLMQDASGTTSPEYAKKMVEYNCQKLWGFVSTCKDLEKGVQNMTKTEHEEMSNGEREQRDEHV